MSWKNTGHKQLIAACLSVLSSALPCLALEPGDALPGIPELTDVEEQVAGREGRVLYLDFWASWCAPCRSSFPVMEALYQKYHERGFDILAINLDENRADAEAFLKDYETTFSVKFDPKGTSAELCGVKKMPSSYLVDRRGMVRKVISGFKKEKAEQIEIELEKLLSET